MHHMPAFKHCFIVQPELMVIINDHRPSELASWSLPCHLLVHLLLGFVLNLLLGLLWKVLEEARILDVGFLCARFTELGAFEVEIASHIALEHIVLCTAPPGQASWCSLGRRNTARHHA